jgi:hypothetical protein
LRAHPSAPNPSVKHRENHDDPKDEHDDEKQQVEFIDPQHAVEKVKSQRWNIKPHDVKERQYHDENRA